MSLVSVKTVQTNKFPKTYIVKGLEINLTRLNKSKISFPEILLIVFIYTYITMKSKSKNSCTSDSVKAIFLTGCGLSFLK